VSYRTADAGDIPSYPNEELEIFCYRQKGLAKYVACSGGFAYDFTNKAVSGVPQNIMSSSSPPVVEITYDPIEYNFCYAGTYFWSQGDTARIFVQDCTSGIFCSGYYADFYYNLEPR